VQFDRHDPSPRLLWKSRSGSQVPARVPFPRVCHLRLSW
jgi:hypothetical protein